MRLCDVNVLVYAHREDSALHPACHEWLEALINGDEAYAVSELVLSGFLRVVTHPKVFSKPTSLAETLVFANQLLEQPNAVFVGPGARHWRIFEGLCRAHGVRGNLVPDAYLAALAIESGCEFVTTDRDFARFQGLRTSNPFA